MSGQQQQQQQQQAESAAVFDTPKVANAPAGSTSAPETSSSSSSSSSNGSKVTPTSPGSVDKELKSSSNSTSDLNTKSELKFRESLYRLIISQLFYDGHQHIAVGLSGIIQVNMNYQRVACTSICTKLLLLHKIHSEFSRRRRVRPPIDCSI